MSKKTIKTTPAEFSLILRDALREDTRTVPMAQIPKNKRPFYEQVIVDYEATKQCHSPTGMTASIVMAWLKHKGRSFTLIYDVDVNCFSVIEK